MKAHHIEEGAADNATLNCAGLAEPNHCETKDGEVPEGAQGLHTGPQILDLRDGKRSVNGADAWRTLPNIDQSVFIAVDQRLQKDAAY
jgi:hypothetical protein